MKSETHQALKIGVAGGIGSGKTTICQFIEKRGYPVFYSDLEAKKIMNSNEHVISEIIKFFGSNAYQSKKLNSAHLAAVAFNNPSLLGELNQLVHPAVRASFEHFVEAHQDKKLVFNEAAILFETGAYQTFDYNILITAPKELRLERVANRDQIEPQQVENRMKNQWSDEKKIPLADFVIQNNGQTDLIQKVDEIIANLLEKWEQKNKGFN